MGFSQLAAGFLGVNNSRHLRSSLVIYLTAVVLLPDKGF